MNKRSFYRSVVYSILYLSQFILRSRKLNNCKPIVISNGSRFIVLGVFKYQSTGLQNYKSPDTGNYVSKFVMCKRLGDFFCWLLLYWLLRRVNILVERDGRLLDNNCPDNLVTGVESRTRLRSITPQVIRKNS